MKFVCLLKMGNSYVDAHPTILHRVVIYDPSTGELAHAGSNEYGRGPAWWSDWAHVYAPGSPELRGERYSYTCFVPLELFKNES